MPKITVKELAGTLQQLQAQVAEISHRIAMLETGAAAVTHKAKANGAPAVPVRPVEAAPVRLPPAPAITEEELLAISAAIGAYLGVRAHIRQIRLLSTSAWAQQGRVSIQASHMLQG